MTLRSLPFLLCTALAALVSGCDNTPPGGCNPACGDFESCCEGACVFLGSDPNNCGGCGVVCPSGVCQASVCMTTNPVDGGPPASDCRPECVADQRCCGTRCVERSVMAGTDGRSSPSFMNCGGCGIECNPERSSACAVPGGGAGDPTCLCGDFPECVLGDVCVADATLGFTCTNLSTDVNNCGAVGNRCEEGQRCFGGSCGCGAGGVVCGETEACCEEACIDVSEDTENCGGCGVTCGETGPTCSGGQCLCGSEPACAAPGAAGLGGSCCNDECVPNSESSCGCDVTCASGDECWYSEGGLMLPGFPGGEEGLCCGEPPLFMIPGFPPIGGTCSDPAPPDAGMPDAGPFDAGPDAGPFDAGSDAGVDAGPDSGITPVDAGPEDAGTDAGADAGPPPV